MSMWFAGMLSACSLGSSSVDEASGTIYPSKWLRVSGCQRLVDRVRTGLTFAFNGPKLTPETPHASWKVFTRKSYLRQRVTNDSHPRSSSGLSAPRARRREASESTLRTALAIRRTASPRLAIPGLPLWGVPRKMTPFVERTMSLIFSSSDPSDRRKTLR